MSWSYGRRWKVIQPTNTWDLASSWARLGVGKRYESSWNSCHPLLQQPLLRNRNERRCSCKTLRKNWRAKIKHTSRKQKHQVRNRAEAIVSFDWGVKKQHSKPLRNQWKKRRRAQKTNQLNEGTRWRTLSNRWSKWGVERRATKNVEVKWRAHKAEGKQKRWDEWDHGKASQSRGREHKAAQWTNDLDSSRSRQTERGVSQIVARRLEK